jgi:PadR family transcriptional regulator
MDDRPGLATALRRGTLEFCVLALLADGKRYGVELVRQLGAETALATSEGTLYPLLSRLRRSGWVATTSQLCQYPILIMTISRRSSVTMHPSRR